MGWHLHFELGWRDGDAPSEALRKASDVLHRCLRKAKNIGLVVMEPDEVEPRRGDVQILLRDRAEEDFVRIVDALQRAARDEPRLVVTASDTFYLSGEDVLKLGDPRTIVEPDETRGTGTFRSDPLTSGDNVYRAARAALDAHAVAASFLARLTDEQLIAWAGPRDVAVEQVAQLVALVDRGQWRGAADVLLVLERDDAVDEIFATDAQLDKAWRSTLQDA
jgi:hypothetical protein